MSNSYYCDGIIFILHITTIIKQILVPKQMIKSQEFLKMCVCGGGGRGGDVSGQFGQKPFPPGTIGTN